MKETSNIRMERIEKLLKELEYEITRGIIEKEIDETLTFSFIVPISQKIKDGVVLCKFSTRPRTRFDIIVEYDFNPKLRIVK